MPSLSSLFSKKSSPKAGKQRKPEESSTPLKDRITVLHPHRGSITSAPDMARMPAAIGPPTTSSHPQESSHAAHKTPAQPVQPHTSDHTHTGHHNLSTHSSAPQVTSDGPLGKPLVDWRGSEWVAFMLDFEELLMSAPDLTILSRTF